MTLSSLKSFVKSTPAVYRTAKLARDFRRFPLDRHDLFQKIPTIWKVFPATMLPPVRLYNFADAVEAINAEGITGSIVECGVWSGGALAFAALWNERLGGHQRHYHGFDSFEGLPPPTPEDSGVYEIFVDQRGPAGAPAEKVLVRTGICQGDAADSVRQLFHDVGVPPERTHFHVGWFQDTLPQAVAAVTPIAILRLDGDWYESTRVCLETLYGKVVANGFVIIDDYGCFTGCKKAVDEFMAANGIAVPLQWVDDHCVFFRKPAA